MKYIITGKEILKMLKIMTKHKIFFGTIIICTAWAFAADNIALLVDAAGRLMETVARLI